MMQKTRIIDSLIDIGSVKTGEFKLKSGRISPIYIDLRIIVSVPELLRWIAEELWAIAAGLSYDRVAGIPFTALPIATAFSLVSGTAMIYARKERKTYGTGQRIEGIWQPGQQVLVIDDLITDGGSKLETFAVFQEAGLRIRDTLVLIDREQGGSEKLRQAGYQVISLISIFEILARMRDRQKIDPETLNYIQQYIDTIHS